MARPAKPQPRKRGTIAPEGDGKYRVRIYVGTDADGKRQYVSALSVGTISQANRKLTAMLKDIDAGTLARPTGETVGEFLPRFLLDVKKNSVQAGTLRAYDNYAKNLVLPALGRIRMEELSSFRIQSWIGELVDKGLSYATIRHAWNVLDMACGQAVLWNMIARNPCKATTLPSQLKAKRRKPTPFTVAQLHSFLAGIDGINKSYSRYKALVHVLLTLGLRPSEAGAVKWCDMDFTSGKLTVRGALEQVTAGTWKMRESTKTGAGMRTLAVPASVIALLQQHRTAQLRERLAAGEAWIDQDFIFTTRHGGFIQPNNMARIWKAMCKATGVPTIPLYDARHTSATMELLAGVDPKTVSVRRGHASVAFTLDTYTHVLDTMDNGAADTMDRLLKLAPKRAAL